MVARAEGAGGGQGKFGILIITIGSSAGGGGGGGGVGGGGTEADSVVMSRSVEADPQLVAANSRRAIATMRIVIIMPFDENGTRRRQAGIGSGASMLTLRIA
jgi:hypothetical protein